MKGALPAEVVPSGDERPPEADARCENLRPVEMLRGHLALLADPANWHDNPFAGRDARRDARRGQPWRSYVLTLAGLLAVAGLLLWALSLMRARGHGVPGFLGGSAGTLLVIVLGGIHAWFISAAAQKHAHGVLDHEAARNTLPSLLMLPAPAFQTLAQGALYPWLAAMRVALVGLPFYGMCLALGGFSLLDLFGLYLVFAFVALQAPACSRPMLADNVIFPTPAQANPLVAQAAAKTAANTTPTPLALIPYNAMMVAFLVPALVSRTGGPAAYLGVLQRYVPADILPLLPAFAISWPLVAARILFTPFSWFGLPLPPLPFVAAGLLLGLYLKLVRSSEFMRVGYYRDLPARPTYLPRRRMQGALNIAWALLFTGYLWPWAVADGGLAALTPVKLAQAPGLAGFAYLLLLATALRLMYRAGAVGEWRNGPAPIWALAYRHLTPRAALRHVLKPLAFAGCFYLVCCLLGRVWPFPLALLPLMGRMLAVAAAGAAFSFAARRALGQNAWLGILLPPVLLFGGQSYSLLTAFSPTLALLHLGNLPAMMTLFFPPVIAPFLRALPSWWTACMACGAMAVLLTIWRPARQRVKGYEPASAAAFDPTVVGGEVFGDMPTQAQVDAAKARVAEMREREAARGSAPSRPEAATMIVPMNRADTPLALRLIAFIQRLGDNAVAMKELRARLRGKLEPNSPLVALIILTFITAVLASVPPL